MAMRFILDIELGNDDMDSPYDVARAFIEVTRDLNRDGFAGEGENVLIHDVNGNTVGHWVVVDVVDVPVIADAPKRVTVHYGSYNGRRYSKPWIARVTAWPVGGHPVLDFGSYLGGDGGGDLEIMAKPGDILRHGQKDGRGHGGSNVWAVVEADYSVRNNITQAEARKLYK